MGRAEASGKEKKTIKNTISINQGSVTRRIPQWQLHLSTTNNHQSGTLALDRLPEEQVACRPI